MERFNILYTDLLKFLIDVCPKFKKYIVINSNPDKNYLINFIELNLPYMEDISVKNADIFKYKHKDAELVRGIKFRKVLNRLSSKNLEILWKRLHSLYILAYNSCNLKKMVEDNYSDNRDIMGVIENNEIIIENITMNFHKGYEKERGKKGSGKKESSEEDEESDDDGEGEGDFDISNLGKMFGQFFNDKNSSKGEYKGKENKQEKERGKDDDNDNNDNKKSENSENGEGENADIFQGTIIGELAKELSSEIDPKDFEEIKDPADIFKMIMGARQNSGGEGNKFGNVMEKVIKKLDEKVKKGDINQAKLFEEAQKVMGNLMSRGGNNSGDLPREFGNLGNMMRQFGMMQGLGGLSKGGKNKKKHRRHRKR